MTAKMTRLMTPRNFFFLLFNIVTVTIFNAPLRELAGLSMKSELYSHILLIPLISGYFLYGKRREIFSAAQYCYTFGPLFSLVGIILYFVSLNQGARLNANDLMALRVFSIVIFWSGGFLFFYGMRSSRIAAFPILFLFLLAPIPSVLVEKFILFLQFYSTEATHLLFKVTGVPILREGFTFHLPGLSIEVAKQCSGIRSSLALVITSLVAGELFLQTGWKKLILVLCAIPITILKNGLRITTLSLLGVYVDPRILGSELHKSGGIPFFILALAVMAPILFWLIKTERKGTGGSAQGTGSREKGVGGRV
jgi:exosortase